MPFTFPSSPTVGQQSTQNGRAYSWSGYAWEIVATPAALSASVITSGTLDIARIPTGSTSSTVCIGNDARLSDTRTPTDGSVSTAKIANDAVTYAKIQNVSATDRLLGRSSAGAGDVEEITCTAFGRSLIDDADAAAARTTLSVQPTASPAFTGTLTAATCSFSGTVTVTSPLVLTGTVAGNVRQLRMQTSGSTRWEVGPGFDAESGSNVGSTFWITRWSDAGAFLGTPISIARATGVVTFESQVLVTAGSVSACSVAASGDANTGLYYPAADTVGIVTGGSERVRVKSTGSVRFVPLSADPASENEAGDVYYNSSTNKLRVYNGTSWVDLH